MYSTCLFCHAHLGRNEAIEEFPVGRRLAYDAAKGRLWVVCRACERWNLTPLESRWEAIEEAERLFRATKLRRASDNIALAEVREGLQLVRIGAPPPLEFAAWRYGDQFGRRWRRTVLLGSTLGVGATALALSPIVGMATGVSLFSAPQLLYQGIFFWYRHRHRRKFVATVRDQSGVDHPMTLENARCIELAPLGNREPWDVMVPYGGVGAHTDDRALRLSGDAAHRALAAILPLLNQDGGSQRAVRDASTAVEESASVRALIELACRNRTPHWSPFKVPRYTSNVAILPRRFRLALEMSLHAEDEQRAMDGELAELERRWRAAEEVAAIADSLLIAPDIEQKLGTLAARSRAGE